MKKLLLNNIVKFTSFVKFNKKFKHNYACERINHGKNDEIYKF